MSVVVIGLNHRTVPLDLLERMTVDDARLGKALHDVESRDNVSEAVVLSTCNRLEIYVVAERFHGAYEDIRNFLSETAFMPPEQFGDHLYVHYDEDAVAHLFACRRRARLRGRRRGRDPGSGAHGVGTGARRGHGGRPAQPVVPSRARGRQASPHRDRHRPSRRVGVDRRGRHGRRPPARSGWSPGAGAGRRRDGRRHGARAGRRRRRRAAPWPTAPGNAPSSWPRR